MGLITKLFFNNNITATESINPDYYLLAKAYGIKAVEANKENFEEIIKFAIAQKDSILVNVIIDKEQKLLPKLEFGNPLEDMYPYLTDNEIEQNMIVKPLPRRDNTQGWINLNK